MQRDETHALVDDALVDALGDGILDFVVDRVSPPDQHIGLVEHRFAQSMFRFIEGRRFTGEALFVAKERRWRRGCRRDRFF